MLESSLCLCVRDWCVCGRVVCACVGEISVCERLVCVGE